MQTPAEILLVGTLPPVSDPDLLESYTWSKSPGNIFIKLRLRLIPSKCLVDHWVRSDFRHIDVRYLFFN